MKSLILLAICISSSMTMSVDGFYSFSVTTLDGQTVSMSTLQGKKAMLVVLPVTSTTSDSLYLSTLDSLSRAYESQVTMIGFPSFEDGYSADSLSSLTIWYRSIIGNQFVISRGIYTRKASAGQDSIFAWLTHASSNGHFDQDVDGPGQTYFINENGQLYTMIAPGIPLTNRIMQKLLH